MLKSNKKMFMLGCGISWLAIMHTAIADIKSDAEIILNWAEKTFSTFLPSAQVTQGIDPWLFRAYPSTDFYVGINSRDNGVYYITGELLRKGGAPTYYDSVSNTLKLATNSISSTAFCDATKLPVGHTLTQSGNTVSIKTNGCVLEPTYQPDYCPQQATASGGVSVLSTMETTSSSVGGTDTAKIVSCNINVQSSTAMPIIELDLCYNDSSNPPISTKTQGKITYQQVADCFKTDAEFVTDIANDVSWTNTGNGFIKF